jgi:hypothetical protein
MKKVLLFEGFICFVTSEMHFKFFDSKIILRRAYPTLPSLLQLSGFTLCLCICRKYHFYQPHENLCHFQDLKSKFKIKLHYSCIILAMVLFSNYYC